MKFWRVLAPLCFAVCPGAFADPAALQSDIAAAITLYHGGKVLSAVTRLETSIAEHGSQASADEASAALYLLLTMCVLAQRHDCVAKHTAPFARLSQPSSDPLRTQIAINRKLYYLAYLALLRNDLDDRRRVLESLAEGRWLNAIDPIPDPTLYIRSQLLAARFYLADREYAGARFAIDKAFSLLVSLRKPDSFFVAVSLSEIIQILLYAGDPARAASLYLVSANFVARVLPASGPDHAVFRIREAQLLAYLGDHQGAVKGLQLAEMLVSRLEIPERQHQAILAEINTDLALNCLMAGDTPCAEAAIERHPFNSNRAELVRGGRFSSPGALAFAAVDVLIRRYAKKPMPDEWRPAFDAEPDFGNFGFDPLGKRQYTAYRLAGRGIMRIDVDRFDAARDLVESGRITLEGVDHLFQQAEDNAPLVGSLEKLLMQFAIEGLAREEQVVPDRFELAFKLFEAYNRSVRQAAADTLSLRARLPSPEMRRLAHARARLASRQAFLERLRLRDMLDSISTGKFPSGDNQFVVHDLPMRQQLADFGTLRHEIGKAIRAAAGAETARLRLPELRELESILRSDEAYVTLVALGGQLAHLCIRKGGVTLTTTGFDRPLFIADTRLLQAALTASHPPSEQLDSQYPVEAAQRLYRVLVAPIEGCLREGDHIAWAPDPYLLTLPLGALLRDAPPAKGSGYDLGKAAWLAKRFSFSYVTSARGFIAARVLGKGLHADLPFLGVGDPVLSGVTSDGIARGGSILRGSAPTSGGALQTLLELPDTGRELTEIHRIAGGDARVLIREEATEMQVRRQVLTRYALLDFATHGLLREEVPGLNEAALVLTPERSDDPSDDGLLTASEIADLDLNARLVVLSACNTANFEYHLFANEVQGLSTAFAMAGAPATLATLWPVETATSRIIVTDVFRQLLSRPNQTASRALSVALSQFLDRPPARAFLHPRFWAPFTIFGDGAALQDSTAYREVEYRTADVTIDHQRVGGEVVMAALDTDGASFYIAGYAGYESGHFTSFVARVDDRGKAHWTVRPADISFSRVLVPVEDGVIVAGSYWGSPRRAGGPAVLLKFGRDGKERWRRTLDFGGEDGYPAGAVRLSKDEIGVGMVLSSGGETPKRKRAMLLSVISADGDERRSTRLSLPEGTSFPGATLHLAGGHLFFAVTDFFVRPPDQRGYVDGYREVRPCRNLDETRLYVLNPRTLNVIAGRQVSGFRFSAILQAPSGAILGAGTTQARCAWRDAATVVAIGADAEITPLYVEPGPFSSSGKALVPTADGRFALLGTSERTVSVKSIADNRISLSELGDPTRWKIDPNKIADGFLLAIDDKGKTYTRSWLQTGGPVWINDALTTPTGVVVVGGIGRQAMWARFVR